jgi:hypothetical protein
MPNRRQWGIGAAAVATGLAAAAVFWPGKNLDDFVMDAPVQVLSQEVPPGVYINEGILCASVARVGGDDYVLSVSDCSKEEKPVLFEIDLEGHKHFFALNRPPGSFGVSGYRPGRPDGSGLGATQRTPKACSEVYDIAKEVLKRMDETAEGYAARSMRVH